MLVEIAAAAQSRGKLGCRVTVASPEASNAVAILAVPFGPLHRKVADLIAVVPDIPRLGDQLHLRQDRVLMQDVEEPAEPVEVERLAAECCREIKTKPIDVHLAHPVTQAVGHELQDSRRLHVQRVAAAGHIVIVTRITRHQAVVRGIVHSLERQRRAKLIPFACVVVDDIQDHLEPVPVQCSHHAFELVDRSLRIAICGQSKIGGEEAERVVAPIIGQPAFRHESLVNVMMDGQQLDGGHSQRTEMPQRTFIRQPGIRPAMLLRHPRTLEREALYVHLVNQRLVPRRARRRVSQPTK